MRKAMCRSGFVAGGLGDLDDDVTTISRPCAGALPRGGSEARGHGRGPMAFYSRRLERGSPEGTKDEVTFERHWWLNRRTT
jgi:hypothetical protein